MKRYSDLEFLRLSKGRKFLYNFLSFFAAIPRDIGKLFVGIGRFIKNLFVGLGRDIGEIFSTFGKGA